MLASHEGKDPDKSKGRDRETDRWGSMEMTILYEFSYGGKLGW